MGASKSCITVVAYSICVQTGSTCWWTQAGVDVSKHGGHAYPGMEDVYNVELEHMASDDVMTDVPDHKFHGSSGVDYPGSHSSKLQSQVGFRHPFGVKCLLDDPHPSLHTLFVSYNHRSGLVTLPVSNGCMVTLILACTIYLQGVITGWV